LIHWRDSPLKESYPFNPHEHFSLFTFHSSLIICPSAVYLRPAETLIDFIADPVQFRMPVFTYITVSTYGFRALICDMPSYCHNFDAYKSKIKDPNPLFCLYIFTEYAGVMG
jgi:hypothetical protein